MLPRRLGVAIRGARAFLAHAPADPDSAKRSRAAQEGNIDRITNQTFAGRSASLRMYHLNHELP